MGEHDVLALVFACNVINVAGGTVAQGMIDNGHAKRHVTGRAKSVETRPADTKSVETR